MNVREASTRGREAYFTQTMCAVTRLGLGGTSWPWVAQETLRSTGSGCPGGQPTRLEVLPQQRPVLHIRRSQGAVLDVGSRDGHSGVTAATEGDGQRQGGCDVLRQILGICAITLVASPRGGTGAVALSHPRRVYGHGLRPVPLCLSHPKGTPQRGPCSLRPCGVPLRPPPVERPNRGTPQRTPQRSSVPLEGL